MVNNSVSIDIDKIINGADKALKLPPSNLKRGDLIDGAVSTGSLALDLMIGGGFAPGRRSTLVGREGAGKSTIIYHAVKACLDARIHVVFYDCEGSTDADRIERIGIKIAKKLKKDHPVYFRYYNEMQDGEQIFAHAHKIMEELPNKSDGPVQVAFFLDSVPTVVPRAMSEKTDTAQPALRARLFGNQLPLIKSRIAAKRCIWIDSNQLRDKPGGYGNPEYEAGGDAVKSLSDCRVKAKKTVAPVGRGRPESKKYIEEESAVFLPGDDIDEAGNPRTAKDVYMFSDLYSVKNKSFSPFRRSYIRIWVSHAGVPMGCIDPVYDLFEYLRMTGQVRMKREGGVPKFFITLPGFDRFTVDEDEVNDKGEVVVDDNGVVKTAPVEYDRYRWDQLKLRVLSDQSFIKAARKQITGGDAFRLYFEQIEHQSTGKAS